MKLTNFDWQAAARSRAEPPAGEDSRPSGGGAAASAAGSTYPTTDCAFDPDDPWTREHLFNIQQEA